MARHILSTLLTLLSASRPAEAVDDMTGIRAFAPLDFRNVAIAGIDEGALGERKETAGASIENQSRPVAVLNVGGPKDKFSRRPSVSTRRWRMSL
jgi:hypothetical protein